MTAEPRCDRQQPAGGDHRAASSSARLASWVFVAFVALAGCALVGHIGRFYWFNGDEFEFLAHRDAGKLSDLFRAHNEHLPLLPILVYRLLWHCVGLRSYLPYQLPVIALHLAAAALLRIIMRRAGVHPWIATAAAAAFVLFGPGEENILWAFQIGFTGSLAFGLAQLVAADHAGSIDRRDWLALGLGAAGMLCSDPLLLGTVGAVVLVRRGWRAALFQTIPLAAFYAAWSAGFGPERVLDPYGRGVDVAAIGRFVGVGLAATFTDLAGNAILGILFAVVLAIGSLAAWYAAPRGARLRHVVTPWALFATGVCFLVLSGYGRWWIGPDVGRSSRYVHLVAALSLPALAVAFDALARRRRAAVAVAALAFVVGLPRNAAAFGTQPFNARYFAMRRELIAALARSPLAAAVPRDTRPDPLWTNYVTAGWLLDALAAGKLPPLEDPQDALDPTFRLRFGMAVTEGPLPHADRCTVVREPVELRPQRGEEIGVLVGPWTHPKDGWFAKQSYTMQLLENGRPVGAPLLLHPAVGHRLVAQLDGLQVRVALAPGTESVILCR
jgi:hypothetical protein